MSMVKKHFGINSPRVYEMEALPNNCGHEIASKEIVGIEVEVENVEGVNVLRPVWQAKNDNSLRNNGMEFVSMPIRACHAPGALQSLFTESLGADCCYSPRTSVHVHLNFADNNLEDVINLLLMYCVFERQFYRFVGRARIKNIFCVPITETALLVQSAVRGLRMDNWQKYSGLNLRPLGEIGTVEFRHMHGTPDVYKLAVWIDMITRLKEYVLKKGTKEVRAMVSGMNQETNFYQIIEEVFGDLAPKFKMVSLEDVFFTYPIAKMLLAKPSASIVNLQRSFTADSVFNKMRNA